MTRRAIHTTAEAIALINEAHISEDGWCCPGSVLAFAIFIYEQRLTLGPDDVEVQLERYLSERFPLKQFEPA